MITTILNYFAEVLALNVGALTQSCGPVETLTVQSDDTTKTLPVWFEPERQEYVDAFPDRSLGALSFFLIETISGVDANKRVATMTARVRHYIWADLRAINPPNIDTLAALCISHISKISLIGQASIHVQFRNELPKSRALWNAWSLPDEQLQYLAPPFDFRVMDYEIQYRVPLNCAEHISAINAAC